jgi:serine protease Do
MAPSDSLQGEWALVVARRPDGGFVSTAGVVGGRLLGTCAERDVSEYVIGTPLLDGFAGAGIFDLAGRVVGIVARCGHRLAALPTSEVTRLLVAPDSLGTASSSRFGFAVEPLSAAARRYFRIDSGLLVTAVTDGSPADRAGWVPGDVIAGVDDVRIDGSVVTATLDSLWQADSHVVVIQRARNRLTTRLMVPSTDTSPADAGLAFGEPPNGIVIDGVRTGSPAERTGLRRGDRLVRVGGTVVTSAPQARRLLERIARSDTATFIVFHRDSVTRGVLLAR